MFVGGDCEESILAAREYCKRYDDGHMAMKRRADEHGTHIVVIALKPVDVVIND